MTLKQMCHLDEIAWKGSEEQWIPLLWSNCIQRPTFDLSVLMCMVYISDQFLHPCVGTHSCGITVTCNPDAVSSVGWEGCS